MARNVCRKSRARFVLDAMPGQQMSIDADLNMGLIDQDEARKRRKDLEKEAGFYGSMDGASKFVKGDAIAGIIILLINIIGGLAVGVAQMGMPWGEAAQVFTLLTIGDGIVTQVPALVISVATGIIVTRSASDNQLSLEVVRQLASFPKIQLLVMVALTGLLALPGMPKWPVLILAAIAAAIWLSLRRKAATNSTEQADATQETGNADKASQSPVAPIEVAFGPGLAEAWMPMQRLLSERIANFRKQYSQDMGIMIPSVVFRDDPQLGANDYRILLFGDRYAQASLHHDKTLAIHSSDKNAGQLPGTPTKDPAFGLPAVWIAPEHSAQARTLGYTPVECDDRVHHPCHRSDQGERFHAVAAHGSDRAAGRRAHAPAGPGRGTRAQCAGLERCAARAAGAAGRECLDPQHRPGGRSAGRQGPA